MRLATRAPYAASIGTSTLRRDDAVACPSARCGSIDAPAAVERARVRAPAPRHPREMARAARMACAVRIGRIVAAGTDRTDRFRRRPRATHRTADDGEEIHHAKMGTARCNRRLTAAR
jgi:hypothetical protein